MAFKKNHIPWNKGVKEEKIKVDRKKLYELYVIQKRSIPKTAENLNLTCSTIRLRLMKYGWLRSRVEAQIGHKTSEETKKKISKTLLGNIPWNKNKKGLQIGWLKGTKGVAKATRGSFKRGVIPWNKGKKFMALDKNPNWKGGKSFEPYGQIFNNSLKETIRQRDDYRCQECFRHQDELFSKSGIKYKLNIHHIDYDKNNNDESNLISLCKSCHTQTNFRREDWTEYYRGRIQP